MGQATSVDITEGTYHGAKISSWGDEDPVHADLEAILREKDPPRRVIVAIGSADIEVMDRADNRILFDIPLESIEVLP